MKAFRAIAVGVLAGMFGVVATSANAAEEQKVPRAESELKAPVYRPPLRGAPGGRLGGGTRGTSGRDLLVLSVLAPDHKGLP